MSYQFSPRLAGLNITVGSFLPRIAMPSLAGPDLTPADLVEENQLAVCVYSPDAVNPFPIPPRGVDIEHRFAMLQDVGVTLYVISGLEREFLDNWRELVGLDIRCLSDAAGEFSEMVGIPIKQVEGRNFRTHAAIVLQEDRILALLPETDMVHNFEGLLAALDVAEGLEPGTYDMSDRPWYTEMEAKAELNEHLAKTSPEEQEQSEEPEEVAPLEAES